MDEKDFGSINLSDQKTDQSLSERVCFSVDGKSQETPEQLIARGEGSDKPSVCQKL